MEDSKKSSIRFVQEAIESVDCSGATPKEAVDYKQSEGRSALYNHVKPFFHMEEMFEPLREECRKAVAEVEDSEVRELLSSYLEEELMPPL